MNFFLFFTRNPDSVFYSHVCDYFLSRIAHSYFFFHTKQSVKVFEQYTYKNNIYKRHAALVPLARAYYYHMCIIYCFTILLMFACCGALLTYAK